MTQLKDRCNTCKSIFVCESADYGGTKKDTEFREDCLSNNFKNCTPKAHS